MSVKIYYTVEGKSESVLNAISEMNSYSDSDLEFVPVSEDWGIDDDEYLLHLSTKNVLVCPKDKRNSTAQTRASLSGWVCAPTRLNAESGDQVMAAINFSVFIHG